MRLLVPNKKAWIMKTIAVALLVVIVTVHAKQQDSLEECLTDNGIKPEEYLDLQDKKDPRLHCIMACLFEKEGMMKNGELDKDSTVSVLLKKNDKISKEDMTKIVSSCIDKVSDIVDICDITNEFRKCMDK